MDIPAGVRGASGPVISGAPAWLEKLPLPAARPALPRYVHLELRHLGPPDPRRDDLAVRGSHLLADDPACDDFYTTKATGSGLGLSFVKRIAQAHGGAMTISSAAGKGTTVALRLPVDNPAPEEGTG
ncbi:MAG: ATP-binding protein [bacterium]